MELTGFGHGPASQAISIGDLSPDCSPAGNPPSGLLVSWANSESANEEAMAMNMALKRAQKAQRRKQVVAEERRAEAFEASLPVRVLRPGHTPIQPRLPGE